MLWDAKYNSSAQYGTGMQFFVSILSNVEVWTLYSSTYEAAGTEVEVVL